MAIDIFREGLSQYLQDEIKSQTAEAAVSFNHAAASAIDGDVESSQGEARAANTHLKNAVECEKIIVEVVKFTDLMKDKLSILGIPQPTAEIFSPENIARYLEKAASNENDDEDKSDAERKAELEAIAKSLGNRKKFPDEILYLIDGEEPSVRNVDNIPLTYLDVSSRTYNALIRSQFNYVGRILSCNRKRLLEVRDFGPVGFKDLVSALHRKGIQVVEESTEQGRDVYNYGPRL